MSTKAHPPELKKYMDKRLQLKLNGGRTVTGVLRGFDPYMNIVMDDTVEERSSTQKFKIGMVVVLSSYPHDYTLQPDFLRIATLSTCNVISS